ncbi:MAG TPA: PRC-barrel domain-containing protein, partial [Candidatus Dormibacteraeota bacterium]|nr:PRC-barrel domain-containing protein [Candidatus Dormibacteraeota bacterium]
CANESSSSSSISGTSGTTSQEIQYSKLKDANIATKSGENLGQMEDLLINPRTGKVDYVVLGEGGILGLGEKRVPIPWKAVNISSEKQFTINVDKHKMKSAPTLSKNYSELDQPDYYVTIYRFYEIPVESGAAQSPEGAQSGSSSSGSSSQQSGSSSQQHQ